MDTKNVILNRGQNIDTLRLSERAELLSAVNKIRDAVGSPRMPKYIASLTDAGLFRKFVRLMGKPNRHTKAAYLKLDRIEREDVLYRLIKKQRRAS
jgi:hypothetical protein